MRGSYIICFLIFAYSFQVTVSASAPSSKEDGSWWFSKYFVSADDSSNTANETKRFISEKKPAAETSTTSHFQAFLDANPFKRVTRFFNEWIYQPVDNYFRPSAYQKFKTSVQDKINHIIKSEPKLTIATASASYNPVPAALDKNINSKMADMLGSSSSTAKEVNKFLSSYVVDPIKNALPYDYTSYKSVQETCGKGSRFEWFCIGLLLGVLLIIAFSYIKETIQSNHVYEDFMDTVQDLPSPSDIISNITGQESSEPEPGKRKSPKR